MNQTRLSSLIEAVINTIIGFLISFILWPIASWMFSIPYDAGSHFGVVALFTAASVARGYVIRRWFNARLKRASEIMAKGFISR